MSRDLLGNISSLKASLEIARNRADQAEARLEAVKALHAPYGIYDECPHTHTSVDEPGVVDVESVGLTCKDGLLYTVCRACHCTPDGELREDFDEERDGAWPCPTVRAAEKR